VFLNTAEDERPIAKGHYLKLLVAFSAFPWILAGPR
jgi:hypothetical protein